MAKDEGFVDNFFVANELVLLIVESKSGSLNQTIESELNYLKMNMRIRKLT